METVKTFDRAAHCRRIAQSGGLATAERYGKWHMRAIGIAGAQVTRERHGQLYLTQLLAAKGYRARKSDLFTDIECGKLLHREAKG